MKQISFTPAGCSFWHRNVLACNDRYFTYCSTTTIYMYNIETLRCEKILSFNEANIMMILWPKTHLNKLLVVSAARKLYLCDTENEEFTILFEFENQISAADWGTVNENLLAVAFITGVVRIFDLQTKKTEKTFDFGFSFTKCMKWNRTQENILAVGCEDGLLAIYDMKGKTKKSNFERKDPIILIDWDYHSPNYLLVGHKNGEILLIDTEKMVILQLFDKLATGISSLVWVKGIPGGFITTTERLSTVRTWSVSARTAISTVKVGSQPIVSIFPLCDYQNGAFLFLVSFSDKSIGVYDLSLKKLLFHTEANHSETIFDAQLSLKNPNILATSSYDGSIKIWDVLSMKCLGTMENREKNDGNASLSPAIVKGGITYGVAWSPVEENRLVSSNYAGKVLLWDTLALKLLKEVKPGGNQPIHRIEWNTKHPEFIASGSKEGFFCIYQSKSKDSLEVYKKVKVGSEAYGVSWNGKMLAVGSKDAMVRIYEMGADIQLKSSLKGHTGKVFNVAWHPIYPYILASGSDDKTIRVWNLKTNSSSCLLGHLSYVRPLCWHHEIPWILLSGSWDANLKVWNTVSSACIYTVIDHHSDIYAVSTHPAKPNLFITGSRDNSLRLWDFKSFLDEPQMSCLVFGKWEEKFRETAPEYESLEGKEIFFCGREAREILKLYKAIAPSLDAGFYQKVFAFFSFHKAEDDFWNVVFAILGQENPFSKGKHELVLLEQIERIYQERIGDLEESSSKFFYDSKNKAKDRLTDLANMYLKVGNFERFCEVQIQLGEWDKALAFAPAVSYEHWNNLVQRKAIEYKETDPEEACFLHIISNNGLQAIKGFMNAGNLEDAKLLASLFYNKKIRQIQRKTVKEKQIAAFDEEIQSKLRSLVSRHAERELQLGSPITAATVHLSIRDAYSAVVKLIRGNCMYEAYILAIVMKVEPLIQCLQRFFLQKCGKNNSLIHVSKPLANSFADFQLMLNFYPQSKETIEELSKKLGLPTLESLKKRLFTVTKDSLEYFELNLLTSNNDSFFDLVFDFYTTEFTIKKPENVIFGFKLLEKVKYSKLLLYKDDNFFGMKQALWKGYSNMVVRFYKQLKALLKSPEIKSLFPVPFKSLTMEYLNYLLFNKPITFDKIFEKFKKNQANLIESKFFGRKRNHLESLDKEKRGLLRQNFSRNKICLDIVNLPYNVSRSYQIKSMFTGENIKSTFHCLEDNKSFLELEEALMWSDCNPFSPLNTGYRIDPY